MSHVSRRAFLLGSAGAVALPLIRRSAAAPDDNANEGDDRRYTRVVVSPVAKLHGADFRTETEDRWGSMNLSSYPVSLRLRITNRSDRPLLIPFFDTFYPHLYNPDGSEHNLDGGRDGTRPVMRPLLLDPGQDYTIAPAVRLAFNRDTGERRIVYEDGTGTILHSGQLTLGRYAVAFTYVVTDRWARAFTGHVPEGSLWQGEIKTKPLSIEITGA